MKLYASYNESDGRWLFLSEDSALCYLEVHTEERARRAARLYERYGHTVIFDDPPPLKADLARANRAIFEAVFGTTLH